MKVLLGLVLLITAGASFTTTSWARTVSQSAPPPTASRVFRLSVDGPVAPSDTFWVAYGPLAGTWGIVRMHATSSKLFVAKITLPRGRTVFSFIEGRGVMHTRLGAVPGNPVITIRQVGSTTSTGPVFPLVVWHVPIG